MSARYWKKQSKVGINQKNKAKDKEINNNTKQGIKTINKLNSLILFKKSKMNKPRDKFSKR